MGTKTSSPNAAPRHRLIPLTRREFYRLAEHCCDYAVELAHYDQHRVNLQQCHKFNAWLPELKSYNLLEPRLRVIAPAWPVARWQILTLVFVCGLLLLLALPRVYISSPRALFSVEFLLLVVLYFLPERLYGTTIELIEGKVLRVVEALESLLLNNDMNFTEAAFFQVKENLEKARNELRQQIDLAHRPWRASE